MLFTIKRLSAVAFLALLLLIVTGPQPSSAQGPVTKGPFVAPHVKGVRFTGDLRKLPRTKIQRVPLPSALTSTAPRAPVSQPAAPFRDAARQAPRAPLSMPSPIRNFAGLDYATYGARLQPDANGDVGPNHFVQAVNNSLGVYDKSGTLLTAVNFDDWWYNPSQTEACYNRFHVGDPMVLYNYLADRWVVIDVALQNWNWTGGPVYLCLAVSGSGDPVAGGWLFYAFTAGPNQDYLFPAEPKLGMWPDGLYVATLIQDTNASYAWLSQRAWAIDWTSLFSGTLNSVYFDTSEHPNWVHPFWVLPGNTRRTLPPAGTPNFFGAVWDPSTFYLWKFHVDWTTPLSSTFTELTPLATVPFSSALGGSFPVPEQGGVNLDPLIDNRLLLQLEYRNIGGVESLWANHAVLSDPVNGVTGLRWYQIVDPNGTPTIAQQGTWQPDTKDRFAGSMAVDGNGDMALSYTMTSANDYPTILYAGRLITDTADTLGQGEGTLIAGTGAQTSSPGWGEYFSTTVDPIDDCTFWFTNKYYTATTSANNWLTRIGAFKFPACNPTPYPTNHTVTFDGVVNPNIEWNPKGDKLGTMGMGGIDYYATWDATNLSVAMVGGSLSSNTYVVAVDTDSTNRTPSNTGSTGNLVCAGFNGNGKGDLALVRSAGGTTKYQGNTGSWVGTWSPSGTDAKDNGTNNVEFQLKWTDLGLPPTSNSVGLYLYVCNGTSLVSAWPPENLQSGTTPVLNVETSFASNGSGRIPRTFGRHIGDEQLTISNSGSFSFLNDHVQLANVSGLTGNCTFDATVQGNRDTTDASIIRRIYVLTPGSSCTGLTADLTLKYEDGTMPTNAPDEKNGIATALHMLRQGGSNWADQCPGTPACSYPGTGLVNLAGVSQFSSWTLGTASHPTAVTLSSFQAHAEAQTPDNWIKAGLGLGVMGAIVLGWVWRLHSSR